jgi:uncharacterized protein
VPDAREAADDEEALPLYGDRPLPERRHLPGRTPRPGVRSAPERPVALGVDPSDWWTCGDFLYGVDLWNRRFFWEAHEAWEEPWRAAGRNTPVGRLLQGLILLAAGALKHELGADGPARRLASRGARLVREARTPPPGFDAPAFAAAVEAWVSAARSAPPLLRLDRTRA